MLFNAKKTQKKILPELRIRCSVFLSFAALTAGNYLPDI